VGQGKEDEEGPKIERNKEVSSPYHFYLFVRSTVEKKMMAIDSIILNTGHSNKTNTIMKNREFVASA
jgi:hypothetical protein